MQLDVYKIRVDDTSVADEKSDMNLKTTDDLKDGDMQVDDENLLVADVEDEGSKAKATDDTTLFEVVHELGHCYGDTKFLGVVAHTDECARKVLQNPACSGTFNSNGDSSCACVLNDHNCHLIKNRHVRDKVHVYRIRASSGVAGSKVMHETAFISGESALAADDVERVGRIDDGSASKDKVQFVDINGDSYVVELHDNFGELKYDKNGKLKYSRELRTNVYDNFGELKYDKNGTTQLSVTGNGVLAWHGLQSETADNRVVEAMHALFERAGLATVAGQ